MFRRLLLFSCLVGITGVSSLVRAEAVTDEVQVGSVTGQKAAPRDFEAPEMELGPRHPESVTEFPPIPLRLMEYSGRSTRPREMVSFDLRTRTATLSPGLVATDEGMRRTPSGAAGAIVEPSDQVLNKDFSSLYPVYDPSFGEYPRQVRLSMTFVNSMGQMISGFCSGTMIDSKHVLTAAHCIYMEEDKDHVPVNDWATSVQVDPGYDSGPGPMGSSFAVQLHTWTGWTQDFDYEYDVAVVDLDRPVGALSGWRGVGASSNFSWYESGQWTRYTYPGPNHDDVWVYDGQKMYGQAGTFDHDDGVLIGFDRDMYKGTSGGGALRDGAAWAVRSHAQITPFDQTSWDTRVTHDMLEDILVWLEDDRPASPDLHAMDVRTDNLGAVAGFQIEGLNFLVHNYSKQPFNGTVLYTVVLSPNEVVTSFDHYVTSGTASVNLSAVGSARIHVPAETAYVPPLPEGDYTLGVIITNADFDFSNNVTSGDDALLFGVLCSAQAPPVLVTPENFHPCIPTTTTLNWGSVPGIDVTYEVYVGTSIDTGIVSYSTSATQIQLTNFLEFTEYFWRVRARSGCGAIGNWSPASRFTTKGVVAEVPKLYPGPEEVCVESTVDFTWDEIPGAVAYRVTLYDTVNGITSVIPATGNTVQRSGLIPGVRYYWAIKSQDACGLLSDLGSRHFFTVAHGAAVDAVIASPLEGSCYGPSISFQTVADPLIQRHEFEIQTAAGEPAHTSAAAGHTALISGIAQGDYRWRARVKSCTSIGDAWGAWTEWENFAIDSTGPEFAGPPTSSTHTASEWTRLNFVQTNWAPATDECGIEAYWYVWDQTSDTVPDGTNAVAGDSSGLQSVLETGDNHWFHLAAIDSAGNMSAIQHLGPFTIDATPPSKPVVSSELPSGSWLNAQDLTVVWDASTDEHTGVAGYSIGWTQALEYVLDNVIDETDFTSTLQSVPEGRNSFHVKAIDLVGNASSQAKYDLFVDRGDPFVAPFDVSGEFTTGDFVEVNYHGYHDALTPRSLLTLEISYTKDDGLTWYAAEVCSSPAGVDCDPSGKWPPEGVSAENERPYWRLPWVETTSPVYARVAVVDRAGNRGFRTSQTGVVILTTTGVDQGVPVLAFELSGNVPNPFNPSTTIRYAVPHSSPVTLTVYDVAGRRVRTLVDQAQTGPARYSVVWDGTDESGGRVASGMYVYRLRAGQFSETQRMVLIK